MSILLTNLDAINSETVSTYQDQLAEIIQDKYPMLNLRQGVFRDLVAYLNAVYAAKTSTELDRYRSAQSLLKIEEDPTLADDGVVDGILSNYNITRTEGTYSRGILTLEYESDATYFLPVGTQFTALGETFQTEASYTIYNSSTTNVSDGYTRILRKFQDGNYGCTVPVISSEHGVSNITRGTVFTPVSNSVNITKVYASSDFSSGKNTETNEELIQRLKSGLATPCWGNRYNIENLINSESGLGSIIALSIIGFGDVEMRRDISELFPFSTGGKIDIYAKTYPTVVYDTHTLTAMKTDMVDGKQRWQVTIPFNTLFGFYRVSAIHQPGYSEGVGYTIVNQSVSSGKSGLDKEDAGYTCYQTVTVTFETEDIITDESLKEFDVTITGLDGIGAIQEVLNDYTYKPVTCDALAKAAVPAFVDINVELVEEVVGSFTDDMKQEITKALAESINNTGFNTVLTGGRLIKVIQSVIGNSCTVYSLNMSSEIWGPTGVDYRSTGSMKLEIPNEPENYVTPNTTTWFARDITITLA